MGFAGSAEYYTALDTAMGKGLLVDLGAYGVEGGGEVQFHPIAYEGLADLMMRRRSNAHAAYERTSRKLSIEGTPIDFRNRAQDLNTILFGRGPQDLVAILSDPDLAPDALRTSLRGRPLKPNEKDDPELIAVATRLLADEATQEALMFIVFELTTGMKAPEDPTAKEAGSPDPTESTTPKAPTEPSGKTGEST